MGFRPQKPLKPKEMLKTLRQINTILNLRLLLHEELIPQLRDYRIADGRATFIFPDEFELDVYVASDDNASPFFFLDLRFLFEPAPQISSEFLRAQMDLQMNTILHRDGLRGACDFLHGFSLTHKLVILYRQACELRTGVWAAALKVEQIHRMVVVQYWVDSPQAKSWIEIGISSGKVKGRRKRTDNAITSQIMARWTRNRKEEKDIQLPLDLKELSMERILNAHIARHTSNILKSVRDNLELAAEARSKAEQKVLMTELTTSESEPLDCALQASLGEHPPVTLRIDPITGRLYLDPAKAAAARAQLELERLTDPASDAHGLLSKFLSYDIQLKIEHLAAIAGWEFVHPPSIRLDDIKAWTKREAQRFGLFQPRGWKGSNWHIVYTISLCGECWWTMEMYVHLRFP